MSSFPVWSSVSGLALVLGRSDRLGDGDCKLHVFKALPALCTDGPRPAPSLVPSECREVCVVTESGQALPVAVWYRYLVLSSLVCWMSVSWPHETTFTWPLA